MKRLQIKKFADDYQDWVQGGFSSVQSNLDKMQGALAELDGEDEMGKAWLPDAVRARTNPKAVALEQKVASVIFQSLKTILGGSFSKEEGDKLVAQSYDSRLSDKENSDKVRASVESLRRMAEAKQAAVAYFGENGTLKGFRGAKDGETMKSFTESLKKEALGGDSGKSEADAIREEFSLYRR